ncbi:hypothetical protein [Mycetocola sp. 2940]|uniref:hypothetical protein n=1 Tax=Mycetocola sp. 2940 TaxID=3156452 RepID=UPI00339B3CA7
MRKNSAGSIAIPAKCEVIIVEGTGVIRDEVQDFVDASVWVQSDYEEATRRAIARDAEAGVNATKQPLLPSGTSGKPKKRHFSRTNDLGIEVLQAVRPIIERHPDAYETATVGLIAPLENQRGKKPVARTTL